MNRSLFLPAHLSALIPSLLAAGLLLSSCSRPTEPLPIRDVSFPEAVDLGDQELNQAAATARSSFAQFLATSNNPQTTATAFMAKIQVREPNPPVTEDIWVSSITPDGDTVYTGVVGDIPANLTTLNMSDIVRFTTNQIVEWQYFEREKVVGAQVTRVRRSRMTEDQRKELDATYAPFRFD